MSFTTDIYSQMLMEHMSGAVKNFAFMLDTLSKEKGVVKSSLTIHVGTIVEGQTYLYDEDWDKAGVTNYYVLGSDIFIDIGFVGNLADLRKYMSVDGITRTVKMCIPQSVDAEVTIEVPIASVAHVSVVHGSDTETVVSAPVTSPIPAFVHETEPTNPYAYTAAIDQMLMSGKLH